MTKLAIVLCQNHIMTLTQVTFRLMNLEIPKDTEVKICTGHASIKADSLNEGLDEALKWGADWVYFMDMDTDPPKDVIWRLMRHNKPIVSGLCHTKTAPFPAIAGFIDVNGKYVDRKGRPWKIFYMPWPKNSLVQVDWTGIGCLLVKASVFSHYIYAPFRDKWNEEEGRRSYGHDVLFCQDMRAKEYSVFVDTSCNVGHIGTITVDRVLAEAWFEADMDQRMSKKLRAITQQKDYWDTIWTKEPLSDCRRTYPEDFNIFCKSVKRGASVADIGCGVGVLLSRLKKEKRCCVYGYDFSKQAIEEVKRNKMDGEVIDLRTWKPTGKPARKFDWVFCTHVIEHMDDPVQIFRLAKTLLKPKGRLVISAAKSGMDCVEHVREYEDPHGLAQALYDNDLIPLESRTTDRSHIVVAGLKQKGRRKEKCLVQCIPAVLRT